MAAFRRPIEQEQTVVETSMTTVPPLNCIAGVIKDVSDGSGIQCRRLLPGWEQIPDCERTHYFRLAAQPSTMLGRAASYLIRLYGCRLVTASSQFTIAACIAIRWSENGWSVRMCCSVTLVLPAFLKASANA